MDLREQRFGVEIELVGVSRRAIAVALAEAVGGGIISHTDHELIPQHDTVVIRDYHSLGTSSREWRVVDDGSIPSADGSEVVSPILGYQDIELVQQVIRKLRAIGAKPHYSCSIHIHVDATYHTVKSLVNLIKITYKYEDLIFLAFGTSLSRKSRYAQPMDEGMVYRVLQTKPGYSARELNECWYGYHIPSPGRYNTTRYHGLNLNNVWRAMRTVEFRYPNSTLHAGKVKAWIQFVLALNAKAMNAKGASHKKVDTDNPKYNFRVFMVSGLGLKGDEFKTCRYHMTHHLPGNAAWRNGRSST